MIKLGVVDLKSVARNSLMSKDIARQIAAIKLQAIGIDIDKLTDEQEKYLNSWEEGT